MKLKNRDIKIIQLIYKENSNQQMADHFNKSLRSIEGIKLRLCKKIGVSSNVQLINWALENHIVKPPSSTTFDWVDKKEQLPKDGHAVLVATNGIYEKVRCAILVGNKFFALDRNYSEIEDAVFWCNLPDTSDVLNTANRQTPKLVKGE